MVASRAEAWIETLIAGCTQIAVEVASRAEAWIETLEDNPLPNVALSRLPCGGVD